MTLQSWDFSLLDTGFFRSGQPFHAGEGGYNRIIGHFPPPMSTLQGAIRTALAAARGWRPLQSSKLPDGLGDADSLGLLSLRGPYLLWEEKLLFPAPLSVLIKKNEGNSSSGGEWELRSTHLIPRRRYKCDLGQEVLLPEKKEKLDGAYPPEKLYLTRTGYSTVAGGELVPKDEAFFQDKLWNEEARTGLKRNAATRTAEDRNLYRIVYIRPDYRLKIRVVVEGIPGDWPALQQQILPLGGEGRLAAVDINTITAEDYQKMLPDPPHLQPAADGVVRYTISLVTPVPSGSGEQLKELVLKGPSNAPGKCISACIGKPHLYGGWNLEKQVPRPLKPFLPPGSTWFFEAAAEDVEEIKKLHGSLIVDKEASSYGYGQVLIGKWEVE